MNNPPPVVSCKRPPPKVRDVPSKRKKVTEEIAVTSSMIGSMESSEEQLKSAKATVKRQGLL